MDSLPGDVMRLIAAQLDGVSLAQLGATCWHWLSFANRNDVWKAKCSSLTIEKSSYEEVWKVLFMLNAGGDRFKKLPSYAFNFVREVHCDLEVWLVVFVEESFEKCMLVRVEEVLCNRGITNENAARFSVGSRFYLRQQEPKNSMRVLKLTTHTKYGTEPVQAPNNDFPCVLLMSRCFSIDQKFGYQQLVLNMWRFAEVYKRTLSTSRLSDVFTQFSREQLCLETRRAQLTEIRPCARCRGSVDRHDHYFRDENDRTVVFCSDCARLERYRHALETIEIPFDLKYDVKTCGLKACNFVGEWILKNLLTPLGRNVSRFTDPLCKAVYHDRKRRDVLIRIYEIEFDAVKEREMPQIVPSIPSNEKHLKDVNVDVFEKNILRVQILDFGATIRSFSVEGPLIGAFAATQAKCDWTGIKETAFSLLNLSVGGFNLALLYGVTTSNTSNMALKISHTGTKVGSQEHFAKKGERFVSVDQIFNYNLIFSYENHWSFLDVTDF